MSEDALRCIVAGATGFTGRAVVEELRTRGAEVVAHVRPGSSSLEQYGPVFVARGVEVDTSPWALEAITALVQRVQPTHVFCNIGTTRARMKALEAAGKDGSAASYEAVDFGLTAMLVQAAETLETPPRFVYVSAMGVGPRPLNAYMSARWRAEEAIRRSKLPFTIVRPGLITGPGRDDRRPAEQATGAVMGGVLKVLGVVGARGTVARYRPTDDAELGEAIVHRALHPRSPSDTWEQQDLRPEQWRG